MTEFTVKLKCDMLVDQNWMIGNDPVGHACSNDAEWTNGHFLLCESCRKMLENEPERITFPPRELSGAAYQEKIIREVMAKVRRRTAASKDA